ncbi:transient receptor potential-gamma protein-like [Schistocerca americana]|uniref:transient receptor potential-gamma protein-like n=1 Tax=Schistocerca americana TaxID=7009 RepID=UPI001F500367|nr:transient receptor potential-gamma protein-like [Schistocerca americana]
MEGEAAAVSIRGGGAGAACQSGRASPQLSSAQLGAARCLPASRALMPSPPTESLSSLQGRGVLAARLHFLAPYLCRHPPPTTPGQQGGAGAGAGAVNGRGGARPARPERVEDGSPTPLLGSECRLCVRRMLQRAQETGYININCVDPLGRSALLMAIDNENLEMVELLIEYKVETKDALLHAISEEFVEAVEVLLDHEETLHRPGEPHSWEALPPDTATFTPDITPLILSAHRDNYEIIKILLDRGATLPMPHDVR